MARLMDYLKNRSAENEEALELLHNLADRVKNVEDKAETLEDELSATKIILGVDE